MDDVDRTIKLAWKKKKLEVSAADIEALFREFGSIESVLMGSKGSSCLITFKTLESAVRLNLHTSNFFALNIWTLWLMTLPFFPPTFIRNRHSLP